MDKRCCQCAEVKPIEEFGILRSSKDGRQKRCKLCARSVSKRYYEKNKDAHNERVADWYARNKERRDATSKAWREANPDKLKEYRKKAWLKERGFTLESFEAKVREQGGCCAICKEETTLVIDHDHLCCPASRGCPNCVRGLICSPCNTALGGFRDNPEYLRAAISYLAEYNISARM